MVNKILVAEDDVCLQETLVVFLKECCDNVELMAVATREEALSIIASTDDIAVVVTDLRMPDFGDGEAVAQVAQQKGIKVIILSGTPNDLSEKIRDNCLAVLNKRPSSSKEVATIINGLFL